MMEIPRRNLILDSVYGVHAMLPPEWSSPSGRPQALKLGKSDKPYGVGATLAGVFRGRKTRPERG